MILPEKQITIISGHYGTGKTEFAVNLAIRMAGNNRQTALVDLDIINPYFRSYERRRELESAGVKVYVTSNQGTMDIPALPPDIMSIFVNAGQQSLIDLGGDPVGARVLGYYRPQLEQVDFDFWFVINQRRPENATVEQIRHCLQLTEAMSGRRVTGLINNTHLGRETSVEVLLQGDTFAASVAAELNLPLIYTTVERKFAAELSGHLTGTLFPIDLYMIKPWELSKEKGGHFAWLLEK